MYFKTPILGSFVFSKLANFVVMQNSTSDCDDPRGSVSV